MTLGEDIKQIFEKVISDIDIYSVELSDIQRREAESNITLARLNKCDVRYFIIIIIIIIIDLFNVGCYL